jgi:DNA-binding transcriptional ArsR family regulator
MTNNASPDGTVELAVAFAALSNPSRIDILRHISRCGHCGCKDITAVLPLAQSTISQHLKVLVQAGLIHMETEPPRSRYQINENLVRSLSDTTSNFLDSCCRGDSC